MAKEQMSIKVSSDVENMPEELEAANDIDSTEESGAASNESDLEAFIQGIVN